MFFKEMNIEQVIYCYHIMLIKRYFIRLHLLDSLNYNFLKRV